MIGRRLLIAGALSCTVLSTANAQFAPSGKSGAPGSNPMAGQHTPFSNITTKFDGIEVQVKRLIKDPTEDGAIRLVFLLSNSSKVDRRMLFLGPHTTLVDELGNVYNAVNTVGVEPCTYRKKWHADINWCGKSFGKVATVLHRPCLSP